MSLGGLIKSSQYFTCCTEPYLPSPNHKHSQLSPVEQVGTAKNGKHYWCIRQIHYLVSYWLWN